MTKPAEPATSPLIRLEPAGAGVAALAWSGPADPDVLEGLLRERADRALDPGGPERLRRLEIALSAGDAGGRRAALRSGFRVEGIRRQVLARPDGSFGDEVRYARLAGDVVGGPVGFSSVMNSALPRTRLIAHVLIRDPDGRVLLCRTRFKEDWELPGGIVEAGEPPRLAAAREMVEELGVDRPVGPLLAVDWMPPYLGWDDAVELIFDGGLITEPELDSLVLQPTEIISVQLCTLAEATPHLIPLAARRLAILTELSPGDTVLLQNGSRVP